MPSMWIVMNERIPSYEERNNRHVPSDEGRLDFGFFFRKEDADAFAEELSKVRPGADIFVFENTHGYHSPPPKETYKKKFNAIGEYVLA